jgi:hypothetical protein
MGFVRTTVLMVMGYIAMKALQRAMKNIEASQVKVKVNQPNPQDKIPRLRLDPVTGAYVPEA